MNRLALSLACWAWLCTAAVAQPKAVIVAPDNVQPGDFVLIDGSKSNGTRIEWRLSNDQPFLVGQDATKIATGSRGGRFVVVLVVGDSTGAFDVAICEIDPGAVPPQPTPPNPGPSPPTPVPPPTPTPGPAEPFRSLVQPVVAIAIDPADAGELAAFYAALKYHAATVKTTGELRTAYVAAGKLMFGERLKGKYPPLAPALDAALQSVVGLDLRDLTADDRAKLAALCDAVVWAVGQ